jgi:hypothetical protein
MAEPKEKKPRKPRSDTGGRKRGAKGVVIPEGIVSRMGRIVAPMLAEPNPNLSDRERAVVAKLIADRVASKVEDLLGAWCDAATATETEA